ncbi:hypothetical protein BC829DRAFT_414020 [Chytridium lagenaria]|nr:hypothetical protein BC829DRAFT_414020 [Chytridium lagenaria]
MNSSQISSSPSSSNKNLVNICRPATAIIIKLVLADKTTENSPIQCYGFDVVNAAVASQSSFLPTLVHVSPQPTISSNSTRCNSSTIVPESYREIPWEFVYLLDALNIRKVVVGLMQASPAEELGKQLVEFQRLLIQEGNRRKRLAVDTRNADIFTLLEEIWRRRVEGGGGDEVEEGGISRSSNRVQPSGGAPFSRACIEVIEILSDFWEVSTGYTTTTSYQPLLLEFEEVNFITLMFFVRMWMEMEAQNNGDDINRVAAVVRSQFRHVAGLIPATDPNGLALFEKEMRTAPYSFVRERQLKELEDDDMLMSRIPVKNLRERLYKESYEFIKQQRIDCLVAGAWFPVIREKGRIKNLYRYYRLGPNKKFLHYADFTEMSEKRPLLDILSKRGDLIPFHGYGAGDRYLNRPFSPIFGSKKNASENPALCFSLVSSVSDSATSASLADFVCSSPVQYAEWTDGFNMLLDKNIANRETAEYIHQLTEVGVKLALLDLTGEGVDVPLFAPELPETPALWTFHYDEEGGGLREGLGGLASLAGAMMLGLTQLSANPRDEKDVEGDSDVDGEGDDAVLLSLVQSDVV